MNSVWEKIISLKPDYNLLSFEEVYKDKMNSVYFLICYHNLLEKALCGGIKKEDWDKIQELTKKETDDFLKNKGEVWNFTFIFFKIFVIILYIMKGI